MNKTLTINKINSTHNQQIKLLKKLVHKKYRQQEQKFIVENYTIIHDAWQNNHKLSTLFVTDEFRQKYPKKYKFLQSITPQNNFYLINKQINKSYSQLATPSGVSAIYNIKNRSLDPVKPTVYLNTINDPGNLGTIIRTMLAFGFYNLVVDEKCTDIYNAKTINSAKNSIFAINILKDKHKKYLNSIKNKIPIYATNTQKGHNISHMHIPNNFCLLIGSETHGLDTKIIAMADKNIKIKMNKKLESLNVAIATAIILYKFNQL